MALLVSLASNSSPMTSGNLKVTTLLYCFDSEGRVLLMKRRRAPNIGLWSPPGGKVLIHQGESPYMCACREAKEELGIDITPADLHLVGLVTESSSKGTVHWMMFLFEVKKTLYLERDSCEEGELMFYTREQVTGLEVPATDREFIWPLFWRHRGGFFAVHCHYVQNDLFEWRLLESVQKI